MRVKNDKEEIERESVIYGGFGMIVEIGIEECEELECMGVELGLVLWFFNGGVDGGDKGECF